MPKVSVLMPVYNEEKFLRAAIESILNQTFTDFEFIIINNGSTDNSGEIIKSFNDSRIILIENKTNKGFSDFISSLNKALSLSRGKYIARFDADDLSLPQRLALQIEYLDNHPDIYLLATRAILINEQGQKIGESLYLPNDKIEDLLKIKNRLHNPSIMYRNTQEFFYREKTYFAKDYDFYLRLLTAQKKISCLNQKLIKYRLTKKSASRSNATKQILFAEMSLRFYRQRAESGKDDYDSFEPQSILSIDIETSIDPRVLKIEIENSLRNNDLLRARQFCLKYFKNHNYSNIILIYFLLTFLPLKLFILLIDFAKKLYFKRLN